MTKAGAIYNFWNSFLNAYEENTVPTDAEFPYITYQFVSDSLGKDVLLTAKMHYRSESWTQINAKADEISKYINNIKKPIDFDKGKIWIKQGTFRYTGMGDPDDNMIRINYMTVEAEYLSAY